MMASVNGFLYIFFFFMNAGRQLASPALVHDRLNWGVRERGGKQTTVYT